MAFTRRKEFLNKNYGLNNEKVMNKTLRYSEAETLRASNSVEKQRGATSNSETPHGVYSDMRFFNKEGS